MFLQTLSESFSALSVDDGTLTSAHFDPGHCLLSRLDFRFFSRAIFQGPAPCRFSSRRDLSRPIYARGVCRSGLGASAL